MKLVAFGDSFTKGYANNLSEKESEENSFINQFKNLTSCFTEYVNLAEIGSSNSQITYKVYDYLKNNDIKNTFIFIGWTTFVRNTIWTNETYKRSGHENLFKLFKMFKVNKFYLPESIKKQIFDTERDILALYKILEIKQIPFVMIQSFDDHCLTLENVIGKEVDLPNWINWQYNNNTLMDICTNRYLSDSKHSDYGMNHKEFSCDSNVNLTKCLHPSKEGHIKIAKTILDNVISKIY